MIARSVSGGGGGGGGGGSRGMFAGGAMLPEDTFHTDVKGRIRGMSGKEGGGHVYNLVYILRKLGVRI
jgi:hypothetical protein